MAYLLSSKSTSLYRCAALRRSFEAAPSPQLILSAHAQSRTFEIAAMKHALKSSKYVQASKPAVVLQLTHGSPREASSQRAFQSLPRHLRRRAASHNVRRLPVRLRQKALAEVRGSCPVQIAADQASLSRHRTVPPSPRSAHAPCWVVGGAQTSVSQRHKSGRSARARKSGLRRTSGMRSACT